MITRRQALRAAVGTMAAYAVSPAPGWAEAATVGATAPVERQQLLRQPLPDMADKEVTAITVAYAPGASSPAHRHPCPAFVYVLEGRIVSQVAGEPPATYQAGQMFYEAPDRVHAVSRNASATQPAKLLVFFIAEKGQTLTTPVQ